MPQTATQPLMPAGTTKFLQLAGIFALYFVGVYVWPEPEGLSPQGKHVLVLTAVAVLSWVTQIVPIAVASIFFTVVQGFVGVMPLPVALQNFANPVVFFVFGMFCFALAFERSGLSERLALWFSLRASGSPTRLVFFFMGGGAFLSMFIADIPVVAMLTPIALMLLKENNCEPLKSNFGRALMIGVAMACLIGGMGTPMGAGMNMMTIQFLKDTANINISFLDWSIIGVPVVLVLTPLAWLVTIRIFKPEMKTLAGMELVKERYSALGPLRRSELTFLILAFMNIAMWFTEPLHKTPLPIMAVLGGTVFFLPGINLLDWNFSRNRIGWEALLLNGAGCSLGMAMWKTGAAAWLGTAVLGPVAGAPLWLLICVVGLFTVWVHLLVPNNVALVAVFVPAVIALSQQLGISPAILAIPMGFTASAAMILPIDPVPLITIQSGYYRFLDWSKPGFIVSFAWVAAAAASVMIFGSLLGFL
ncbi:DASS family sodium-coupled anion symporter [Desulfovibrio sp. OttesenSCG-928-C14]|nr:DASS family sodium-coupled anion symporter [Desulfovibrio sp. OttesenSCG-928-C14]